MREYSIPALVEIPAAASLADIVFTRASQDPHAVIMRRLGDRGQWDDVTAGQFRDDVTRLAKGLVAAGIEPGDRVALMSRTRYEWTLIDYAIWTAGAVTVPVYETSSAEQAEWILSDSGARACFAETAGFERMVKTNRLAIDTDFACLRLVDTAENLHQGRLAGAIFAAQRMHLTGSAIK